MIRQFKHGFGPSGFFSYLFFFIAAIILLVLVVGVILDSEHRFLYYALLSTLFLVSMNLSMKPQGLIIDSGRKMFKKYVWFLGFKVGRWQTLSGFTKVVLRTSRLTINPTALTYQERPKQEHYVYFEVILANSDSSNILLVQECSAYQSGLGVLEEVSKFLELPEEDHCAEDMQKSLERRSVRGRRR